MAVTPMMKQYEEAKRACPDALLLFRMGDFYEMFYDDAKTAARVLNLALTSREKGENAIPMAGFPHHQLESYLGKLIAAGMRAAVCEQVEDPKLAKGLVRREVTRIVTPGTVTDDALLDPRESNFLAAVAPGDPAGLAWVELSTGRFVAAGFPARQLPDQLARIAPAECLLSDDAPPLPTHLNERMMVTRRPAWAFSQQTARQVLAKHFGTAGLEGFGFSDGAGRRPGDPRRRGHARLSRRDAEKLARHTSTGCCRTAASGTLEIDESSRRSLEITRTIRDGRREGSLLWVLDRTRHGDGLAAAGRVGGQSADRRGGDPRPARRRGGVGRRSVAVRRLARVAAAGVRRGAAAGPRDHRPGQPARPEFPGPHAAIAAGGEGEAHGAAERAARRSWRRRSIFAPSCGRRSKRRWPTSARWRAARAGSSATASARSWTPCASWPTAASSGSPATRPRRPSGRAFRV